MDKRFTEHVEALRPSIERLLAMPPMRPHALPRGAVPERGVYLLSENGRHLYVGRSNTVRKRLTNHCSLGATQHKAAFAFRLARETTGNHNATYQAGPGSRDELMNDAKFVEAFNASKARIREMEVRYVEESDPTRQALLEIYVAVVLETPYNDFDNH